VKLCEIIDYTTKKGRFSKTGLKVTGVPKEGELASISFRGGRKEAKDAMSRGSRRHQIPRRMRDKKKHNAGTDKDNTEPLMGAMLN
jgi:hypothetical protein